MDRTLHTNVECELCSKMIEDAKYLVTCTVCESNFHSSCAKTNENMQTWNCSICSTLQVPKAPRSTARSKNLSKASSKSSSKAKALLNSLEEEQKLLKRQAEDKQRLLNETHEQELQLLKRKHDILIEIASSKCSSRGSNIDVPQITSQEKVNAWIGKQNVTENLNPTSKDCAMQTDPVAIKFCEPKLLPEVQMPRPLMSSTFTRDNQFKSRDAGFSASLKHNLSREEVAARHVVKELPKFDGNPRAWPRFITSYNRSTEICGFNDFENLERLSVSLTGQAFAAVESSLTMEENVPRILETLEMLFGKPEFIITSLIKEMKMSAPPTSESIDSIIRYSLEVENISTTMKTAKLSDHLWNPVLLSEMVERLPYQIKLEWASYKSKNPESNIEVFGLWLKRKAMEYSSVLVNPPNISRSCERSKPKHSIHVHEEIHKCAVCSKECQKIDECEAFKALPLGEKWNAVRELQLCRICLTKHSSRICSRTELCGMNGCIFKHHPLLHKRKESETISPALNLHLNESKTYFKILPICLKSGNESMTVYAMLDDGSSMTLMDSKIAKAMKLRGARQPLCLRWTGNVERRDNSSQIVNLYVSACNSNQKFILNDVRTVGNLNLPIQTVNMEELSSSYEHLKDIPINSFKDVQPSILIGLSHSKLMAVKKYRFGNHGEPAAAKTNLGWCIFGSKADKSVEVFHINHCDCSEQLDFKLESMIRDNYSLEAIGISNPSVTPRSKDDIRALEILEKTTYFDGRRYQVGLLWKYDSNLLPDNLQMAIRRQRCLEKRFQHEPELLDIIDNHIKDYVSKGYARKLEKNELKTKCWFLPIFIVRNPNKPGKIRLVWDAAAKLNGISLNSALLKGPDLLASLPGVLMRFRQHKVALSGDIKEMFHQVAIRMVDRPFQRFLWRSSTEADYDVYEMNVMTFGATCSPSCSQYIKNINAEKFKTNFPEAVEAIQYNHYVDDWLESVDTKEEAVSLAEKVKHIHKRGGFEIRNWISNEPDVVESMNDFPKCNVTNMEICSKLETDKILGMFWKTSEDSFTYVLRIRECNAAIFEGKIIPTKRELLRILMSVFDPLGLIAYYLIFPKILLQRIWRSKTSWDDEICQEHFSYWLSWAKNVHQLTQISIPRWIGLVSTGSDIEMHCFVDASEEAFAAVIYFKVISQLEAKCSLITAKSRVAPLRAISIPRLELQAAVLGVRLAKFVQSNMSKQHQISKQYFWTDSETVMKWINSDTRKYCQYVSCRVGEILESTTVHDWFWISGSQNVADLATKMKIHEESKFSYWFNGPSFLKEEIYPIKKLNCQETSEELRPQHKIIQINYHEEAEYRTHNWRRLQRTFAYVFRFVNNLRISMIKGEVVSGPITTSEYIQAEYYLFRKAQSEDYAEEYAELKNGNPIHNKRSLIFKDTPFLDEFGVIRSKGRLQLSPYTTYDSKNPILLPRTHKITSMILQHYHKKFHHQFPATVANEVKQKFIIPRMKVLLNTIRRECFFCKIRDAKPNIPQESDLPSARLTSWTLPFTYIGIDYFGPTIVSVGRKREKRWCMLVTCLTTRAIHLEVAHTLSTDSCILGLRRFISRRGKPREIYSDNGTNFNGSRNELREIWKNANKQKVAESFMDEETKWMFIPPASPHMGGAWERMVRSVKRALEVALPIRAPSDELLLTMLAEVEHIINSRPLTYVAIENECEEALTPNHLILGSSNGCKPLGNFQDESSALRANWHKSQLFANLFWKRWSKEYLPSLNRRTKWFTPIEKEVAIGDIVIVLNEEKTGSWPKGKDLDINRGRDGQVRSALVQLQTGVYTRPVSKIAVLDVRSNKNDGTLEPCTRIPGGTVETSDNISQI